jgi:dCMP deaminase
MKSLKFLPIAKEAALMSRDHSTKVGCVVLDEDYNVRAVAYNGFPRGICDGVEERYERPLKYKFTSHAEENAVANAARVGTRLQGCTLLLTSLFPCTTCSRLIIQAGIRRVIAPRVPANTRWDEEARLAMQMLAESGVTVSYYEEN